MMSDSHDDLPKPGLHRDVSYDDYAQWPAVRSSDLKLFARTPAHARYAMTHPEQTSAMILGSATHCAILEPHEFAMRYVEAPKLDRRTNAGKAAWAQFLAEDADRIALDPDEQVTFTTDRGGEYDVARKSWGFYATPSVNGRLAAFGLRAVLVKSPAERFYVMLVEAGHEAAFHDYLAVEGHTIVAWLDDTSSLQTIERAMRDGG